MGISGCVGIIQSQNLKSLLLKIQNSLDKRTWMNWTKINHKLPLWRLTLIFSKIAVQTAKEEKQSYQALWIMTHNND